MAIPIESVVRVLRSRIPRKRAKAEEPQAANAFDPQIHLRLLRLRAEYEQQSRPPRLNKPRPTDEVAEVNLSREVA